MISTNTTRTMTAKKILYLACSAFLVLSWLSLMTSASAFAPQSSLIVGSSHGLKRETHGEKSTMFFKEEFHGMSKCRGGTVVPPRLFASNDDDAVSSSPSSSPEASPQPVDYVALAKWTVGYTGQVSLIHGTLWIFDQILAKYSITLPLWAKIIFFYGFNLQTGVFSLLPNKKTDMQRMTQQDWEYNKRNQPWWTPPGWVFAVMWPLFVFGTRAVTAAMVVSTLDGMNAIRRFSSLPIMALMAHLCIANLWNTINNVERRLGPCVPALWALAVTGGAAAYVFAQVNPLAGKLLALTLSWLTAAAALETDTWRINPDLETGKKEKLYPVKAKKKWVTKFRWEA